MPKRKPRTVDVNGTDYTLEAARDQAQRGHAGAIAGLAAAGLAPNLAPLEEAEEPTTTPSSSSSS